MSVHQTQTEALAPPVLEGVGTGQRHRKTLRKWAKAKAKRDNRHGRHSSRDDLRQAVRSQ